MFHFSGSRALSLSTDRHLQLVFLVLCDVMFHLPTCAMILSSLSNVMGASARPEAL
jgi:hypothetical protein